MSIAGAIARMWYALSKVAKRLRSDIRNRRARGREGYDASAREAELMLRKIEDIRDRFARALIQAKKAANTGTAYSLSANAISDVQKALNDKFFEGEVKLTDSTPSIITDQKGTKNYPMLMNATHIRENVYSEKEAKAKGLKVNESTHYHGLGETLFLEVISELDQVTEAYRGTKNAEKSERNENYFLLISKHTDKNGNIINVPVYINTKGQYNRVFIDTNKVSTVFGRQKLSDYLKRQIQKGNLVRVKRKSPQASEGTSLFNASYSQGASNNSIPQKSGSVNTSDGSFSVSRDTDHIGYEAVNAMEERSREMAEALYADYKAGKDIGLKDGEDVGEYIFAKTGWTHDNSGRLIVDHEYSANNRMDAAGREAWAREKYASIMDAENSKLRSENEGLREQVDATRTAVRDAQGKRSADYSSVAKSARTIIGEVTDMLGGGFTKKQAVGFGKALVKIYDKRGEADAYGVRAASDAEIAADVGALIEDMQNVRYEDAERIETVKKLKAELKTPVYLSETARGDLTEGYGSVAKSYRGRVNFASKERGVPVDVRYKQLSSTFPKFFPTDITNEADQAKKMLEVSDMIRDEEFVGDDRYGFSGGEEVREADAVKAAKVMLDGFAKMDAIPKTEADRYARAAEKAKYDAAVTIATAREQIQSEADAKAEAKVDQIAHNYDVATNEMEAEYREHIKRNDEMVDQIAHNYDVATDEVEAEYRKAIEKNAEQAARSFQKERIKRLVNRLRKLLNKPSKERNVKEGEKDLVERAIDFFEGIFTENFTARDLSKIDPGYASETERANLEHLRELYEQRDMLEEGTNSTKLDSEIKLYVNKLSGLFGRMRREITGAKISSRLSELAAEYLKLKDAKEDYIRDAYSETAYNVLLALANDESLKDKRLRDLSSDDLNKVYKAAAVVVNAVYDSNNLFSGDAAMKADAARVAIHQELEAADGITHTGKDVGVYIFAKTGWTHDNSGRLIVDHEYSANNRMDAAGREAWAREKYASIMDAENSKLRSENEGLKNKIKNFSKTS